MRRIAAFAAPFSSSALRASISVERATPSRTELSWPAFSKSYVIDYSCASIQAPSRIVTCRPYVRLIGLRPGEKYNVRVRGIPVSSSSSNTLSTVVSCASASPATDTSSTNTSTDTELPLTELSRLEVRVGEILEVERHPDADTLYIERVDVGEEAPRTIVSGLVKYVNEEELIGRRVVVLCNLKPRAMRGVQSAGMLLCASNDGKSVVDPLLPHEDSPIGEIVTFEGHRCAPVEPGNRASKAFDRVAEFLNTDENGVARFKDVPFMTASGPCISPKGVVGTVS